MLSFKEYRNGTKLTEDTGNVEIEKLIDTEIDKFVSQLKFSLMQAGSSGVRTRGWWDRFKNTLSNIWHGHSSEKNPYYWQNKFGQLGSTDKFSPEEIANQDESFNYLPLSLNEYKSLKCIIDDMENILVEANDFESLKLGQIINTLASKLKQTLKNIFNTYQPTSTTQANTDTPASSGPQTAPLDLQPSPDPQAEPELDQKSQTEKSATIEDMIAALSAYKDYLKVPNGLRKILGNELPPIILKSNNYYAQLSEILSKRGPGSNIVKRWLRTGRIEGTKPFEQIHGSTSVAIGLEKGEKVDDFLNRISDKEKLLKQNKVDASTQVDTNNAATSTQVDTNNAATSTQVDTNKVNKRKRKKVDTNKVDTSTQVDADNSEVDTLPPDGDNLITPDDNSNDDSNNDSIKQKPNFSDLFNSAEKTKEEKDNLTDLIKKINKAKALGPLLGLIPNNAKIDEINQILNNNSDMFKKLKMSIINYFDDKADENERSAANYNQDEFNSAVDYKSLRSLLNDYFNSDYLESNELEDRENYQMFELQDVDLTPNDIKELFISNLRKTSLFS